MTSFNKYNFKFCSENLEYHKDIFNNSLKKPPTMMANNSGLLTFATVELLFKSDPTDFQHSKPLHHMLNHRRQGERFQKCYN